MKITRGWRGRTTSIGERAERAAVGRAGRRVGMLVGLAVTALVTLEGGIAYTMLVRAQNNQISRELAFTARHGEPTGPPGCTWLFLQKDGVLTSGTVGAPGWLPARDRLDRVAATGVVDVTTVERDGTVYVIRTQPRGDATIQAVFDSRYQLADRRHLLLALAVAELAGLLAAVTAGLVAGRRAVAPLAEALDRQRRFVTDASHELRTPITQVHTRAQLLARRSASARLPADQHAEFERLVSATKRLGDIVDDLLLSARLAALTDQEGVPGGGAVDLASLTESAVDAETIRAVGRQLTLTLHRPDEPLLVHGVESALRRVVGELLTNAVTHTPPGGRIRVAIGRSGDGRLAELTVADTGDGFDPAEAGRMFDRFYRGAGAGDRRFGLGLALLREVVTSHHGTIEAVGEPGRGAQFTVRIPTMVSASTPLPDARRSIPVS